MEFYRAVVEDNNDPEKLGRVKVRIFGLHTDKNENSEEEFEWIQTDQLPWAEIMGGTDFGLINGVGISTVLRQGTWVWCILNHGNPNMPIVMGTIIGKVNERDKYEDGLGFNDKDGVYPFDSRIDEADQNRLARNEKLGDKYYDVEKSVYSSTDTIHKIINDNVDIQEEIKDDQTVTGHGINGEVIVDVSQIEPNSLDDSTEYPNSNVIETHSGHVITLDDTEGNERVRVYHTSGSYIEIRPDGTFVQKSVNTDAESHYIHMSDVQEHVAKGVKRYIEDNIEEIINKSVKRNIKQNLQEHIEGDLHLKVDGNVIWQVGGDVQWNVGQNVRWLVGENQQFDIGSNITINSGGTQTNTNGGNYTHIAPRIDLNP